MTGVRTSTTAITIPRVSLLAAVTLAHLHVTVRLHVIALLLATAHPREIVLLPATVLLLADNLSTARKEGTPNTQTTADSVGITGDLALRL